MGTVIEITLVGDNEEAANKAAFRAFQEMKRIEQLMSPKIEFGDVFRINQFSGKEWVRVSPETIQVIKKAQEISELSEGGFDITVGPLTELWRKARERKAPPSEEEVKEKLDLVNFKNIEMDKEGKVFLKKKGMAIDLGGIAKGYAVDRAFDSCRSAGIEDFLIDLSGNIRVSGRPQWGEDWQIGVRDPFDRSHIIGKVTLRSGMALATSGNYERFVEMGGQRYSHIINPKTGYPVTGTAGVTILAEDATTADGWSTSFFVAGLKGADKFRQKAPSVNVLFVPDKYPTEIWVTPGFAKVFAPLPEFSKAVKVLYP